MAAHPPSAIKPRRPFHVLRDGRDFAESCLRSRRKSSLKFGWTRRGETILWSPCRSKSCRFRSTRRQTRDPLACRLGVCAGIEIAGWPGSIRTGVSPRRRGGRSPARASRNPGEAGLAAAPLQTNGYRMYGFDQKYVFGQWSDHPRTLAAEVPRGLAMITNPLPKARPSV
jgi:hypothetical protein